LLRICLKAFSCWINHAVADAGPLQRHGHSITLHSHGLLRYIGVLLLVSPPICRYFLLKILISLFCAKRALFYVLFEAINSGRGGKKYLSFRGNGYIIYEIIMDNYRDFYCWDGSYVAVEHVNISSSVESHKHKHYELFLIETGSCIHIYNKTETLLTPGDSFLVPAHESHSFSIHKTSSIYNCQFFPDKIDSLETDMIKFDRELYKSDDTPDDHIANISKQGIIHLDPQKRHFLLDIMINMLDEQMKEKNSIKIFKQKYLEIILMNLKMISDRQFKTNLIPPKRRKTVMLETLEYIEENITEKIDFKYLARQQGLSPNHFRKLFKDSTNLSPVEYVNRLRISKACDYLQKSDLPVGDVAGIIGIYDSNYFTRVFKQIMSCTPKQYSMTMQNTAKDIPGI
jgi:AraC-like DNA-binding protein/mannose-6-phosphate isomerase-like protein (cupin superfamily)